MKVSALWLLSAGLVGLLSTHSPAPVAYPEGYRTWTHVKSTFIGSTHPRFATMGGFQHFYANAKGLQGYRTRAFPEGSIIVVDWLELAPKEGAFLEGPRRQIDVMVKDSIRFAASGGWGFQRFKGDSHEELAATPTPEQCFACHKAQGKDGLVVGTSRE